MPSQTAWALLGLMAAGEIQSTEAARGIQYLLDQFEILDGWEDKLFNAVGFPPGFLPQVSRIQRLLSANGTCAIQQT